MIQVTNLTDMEINKIGLTYANYVYPDHDKGMFPFEEKERLVKYINGFAKACMQAGMLYTTSEKHEGYIALSTPDTKYPAKAAITLIKGMFGALGFGGVVKFMKFISKGGESLENKMKKEKRKFVMIELLAVTEEYQNQGHMRTLMDFAFETADQYGLPCIVETDEGVKRDKYCHLGVHQVLTRNFGDNRYSYGMIREVE
ncbi:MAG: GNAT family N-acetyltransferase [Eubacterium sp.]